MAEPRCCILGATGFLGGQIARVAHRQGWKIRGLRRRPNAVGTIGNLPVEWVSGDLSDTASLLAAMRGCPLVFHAAGYYPRRTRDSGEAVRHGVMGMRNVLAAASTAGVRRLVYTSAYTTLGIPSSGLAAENDLYVPTSTTTPYFEVKWAMEMEAMRAVTWGLPIVIALPTAVFGPGDIKPNSSQLLLMIAQGHSPSKSDGQINVVDARDVAEGHLAAANRGRTGGRYVLGGHNLEYQEMLDIMTDTAGQMQQVSSAQGIVRTVARLGARLSSPEPHHLAIIGHWFHVDSALTRNQLSLADPIPFAKTCHDTLEWFYEHGYPQ
ncbi:MAG: NAD-dependent epimerase/dehydratase family protein [Anaerolineae bacterium]|nr:NAD-dependent epimerase/dehydratase family protein [Anaerolineae bacterium]